MNIKNSVYQNIQEFYAWKRQQNFVLKAKKSLAFCLQTVWLIGAENDFLKHSKQRWVNILTCNFAIFVSGRKTVLAFSIITCWKFSSSKFHSLGIDHVKLSEKHLSLWKKRKIKNTTVYERNIARICINVLIWGFQFVNMSMSISAHLCTKCLENLETGDRNVRHEKFTSTSPLDKPSDLALSLKLFQSQLLTMQWVIRRIQSSVPNARLKGSSPKKFSIA